MNACRHKALQIYANIASHSLNPPNIFWYLSSFLFSHASKCNFLKRNSWGESPSLASQPFHHHIRRFCSRTTGRSPISLPHGSVTAAMELIDESAIFGLEDPNQKVVHASPGRNARGHLGRNATGFWTCLFKKVWYHEQNLNLVSKTWQPWKIGKSFPRDLCARTCLAASSPGGATHIT